MEYVHQFLGDSITSGYNDDSGRFGLTNKGISFHRFIDQVNAGQAFDHVFFNLGCSGLTVPKYCKRGMGFVRHGGSRITSMQVSIWSPNVPSGQSSPYQVSAQAFSDNLAALISLENECISKGILFMPFFAYPSPFDLSVNSFQALWNNTQSLKTRWPHLRDLFVGTAWQDSATTTTYKFANGAAVGDATHPVVDCYTALTAQDVLLFPSAFASAKTFYNFT